MLQNGMSYQKSNILQEPNNYLYNGKELQTDFDIDWYDYGARFYDPQLGRWHVPDPMAEARNWLSSYQYTQNTPINRIDPDGRLDDEYKLNQDGRIEFVAKSEGADVLYATNKDGTIDKNRSIKVKKGTFSIGFDQYFKVKGEKPIKGFGIVIFNNEKDAQKVFEFAAENHDGEFGKVSSETESGIEVSTVFTNEKNNEFTITGKIAKIHIKMGGILKSTYHSHTLKIAPIPSGFYKNGRPKKKLRGDRAFAKSFSKNRKGKPILHYMYHPKYNTLTKYDENSISTINNYK